MKRRLSIDPDHPCVFHCMTRVVSGAHLLGEVEREVFCRMLSTVACFHGVQVLSYTVLSNHYHLLARIPSDEQRSAVGRAELLQCYRSLYEESNSPGYPPAHIMESILAADDELAEAWEQRLRRRYGSLPEFMKTLNQRFSIYYNKKHCRYGALWSRPYHSVHVEDDPRCVSRVSAYIDLNPVRAGMVRDPKDYRWSGYGALMGGRPEARVSLTALMGCSDWEEAAADYRKVLYAKGAHGREGEQAGIDPARIREILEQGGKVSVAELFHCRVRYLSAGAVLGTKEFVRKVSHAWRAADGKALPTKGPLALPLQTAQGEEGLYVLRRLVKDRFG